jgi:class 3 adenylate cyclase
LWTSPATPADKEQGDAVAAELAGRLAALVEGISRRYAGRPVRWLGDGGMFVFREPDAAVQAATEMVTQAFVQGLPRPTSGSTAARWSSRTATSTDQRWTSPPGCPPGLRPGEVLVSKPAADRIAQPGRLEPVGVVELKGVAQPLEVWRCPPDPAPGG